MQMKIVSDLVIGSLCHMAHMPSPVWLAVRGRGTAGTKWHSRIDSCSPPNWSSPGSCGGSTQSTARILAWLCASTWQACRQSSWFPWRRSPLTRWCYIGRVAAAPSPIILPIRERCKSGRRRSAPGSYLIHSTQIGLAHFVSPSGAWPASWACSHLRTCAHLKGAPSLLGLISLGSDGPKMLFWAFKS